MNNKCLTVCLTKFCNIYDLANKCNGCSFEKGLV